ncbi:MAG: L-threonylcarbamoyladenylate synthase [bacterium]|nr:L-threonylcarbamoyladenylate synthase [bacterium]
MQTRDDVADMLKNGGVGVLPTDTLYGLVGSALFPDAVARIYELKERGPDKPLIVLIADIEDLEQFGVVLSEKLVGVVRRVPPKADLSSRGLLESYWPGPHSIILPIIDDTFEYLSRGTDSIAFRLPDKEDLRALLRETGPLVAPSANVEGKPPARTIEEAQKYFGDDVDFYVDGGELAGKPSTILLLEGEKVRMIR